MRERWSRNFFICWIFVFHALFICQIFFPERTFYRDFYAILFIFRYLNFLSVVFLTNVALHTCDYAEIYGTHVYSSIPFYCLFCGGL